MTGGRDFDSQDLCVLKRDDSHTDGEGRTRPAGDERGDSVGIGGRAMSGAGARDASVVLDADQ